MTTWPAARKFLQVIVANAPHRATNGAVRRLNAAKLCLTFLAVAGLGISGCKKSAPVKSADAPALVIAPMETVLTAHWVGKFQLTNDPSATNFLNLWDASESKTWLSVVCGKLAAAPWVILNRPVDTNASVLLRPLVEDLANSEAVLEIAFARRPRRASQGGWEQLNGRAALVLCAGCSRG